MTIVGFNFTKLLAEKNKPVKGKINIKNNVVIKDIKESKLDIDPKKKALRFEFVYTSKYEPDIGLIEIGGETVYLADEKLAKDTLAKWKKNKTADAALMREMMNQILAKCNIEAIILSKDLNLPAPIPLPKMK